MEFCNFKKKIDFYKEFEKEAGTNFKNLFLDGLHPNEDGHEIMAEIFSRNISNIKQRGVTNG